MKSPGFGNRGREDDTLNVYADDSYADRSIRQHQVLSERSVIIPLVQLSCYVSFFIHNKYNTNGKENRRQTDQTNTSQPWHIFKEVAGKRHSGNRFAHVTKILCKELFYSISNKYSQQKLLSHSSVSESSFGATAAMGR
jgi:hypothetical protein